MDPFEYQSYEFLNIITLFIFLDFIDYDTFLDHSHPPANHKDYRPLIDFCKANKLPVIAANCSRRHSRLMSRQVMKFIF